MFPPSEESPSRLLIKSASIVLAALRGSMYRSVRLVSSLAAALLDGLSEQPARISEKTVTSERLGFRFPQVVCRQAANCRPTKSAASFYVDSL